MARLLCIGECMLELAPADAGDMYRAGFAGDSFNTAWYAKRLAGPETEVAYFTAVGQDATSRRLELFTRAAGIVPEFLRRADRGLGLYMIHLAAGERSFCYWRDTSAARTLADELETLPGIGAGDLVFFSGITLAILSEAGRARFLAALDRARAAGARVAFDPNIRPRLWPDKASMCAALMEGARRADIVLPSFDDDAAWFGDADPQACAARYAQAGATLVAVKDGARPVWLWHKAGSAWIAPEPAAQIVDSTAAGDAFNAGLLIGLETGLSPAEAVQRGCALSARVIGQRGALAEV